MKDIIACYGGENCEGDRPEHAMGEDDVDGEGEIRGDRESCWVGNGEMILIMLKSRRRDMGKSNGQS